MKSQLCFLNQICTLNEQTVNENTATNLGRICKKSKVECARGGKYGQERARGSKKIKQAKRSVRFQQDDGLP